MARLSKRWFHLVFSLTMGVFMVFIMTFFITLVNVGFAPDFLWRWAKAYVVAYVIAVPVIYFLAPRVRKLVTRWVEAP